MRENARGIMEQADEIRTARAMDTDVDLFVDETQTLSKLFQCVEQLDLDIRDSLGFLAGDDTVCPSPPTRTGVTCPRKGVERKSRGLSLPVTLSPPLAHTLALSPWPRPRADVPRRATGISEVRPAPRALCAHAQRRLRGRAAPAPAAPRARGRGKFGSCGARGE